MTFTGARLEAAILTDSDEETTKIQIGKTSEAVSPNKEGSSSQAKNKPKRNIWDDKKSSPKGRPPLKATKKFELAKKDDINFLDEEPLAPIVLTE